MHGKNALCTGGCCSVCPANVADEKLVQWYSGVIVLAKELCVHAALGFKLLVRSCRHKYKNKTTYFVHGKGALVHLHSIQWIWFALRSVCRTHVVMYHLSLTSEHPKRTPFTAIPLTSHMQFTAHFSLKRPVSYPTAEFHGLYVNESETSLRKETRVTDEWQKRALHWRLLQCFSS
jgi:hypothetical protein